MSLVIPENFPHAELGCVFVGKFNPGMFSPAWLKHYKAIRDTEADSAKIKVIHPSLTQFVVGSFTITVDENKFIIATLDQSSFEALKDLAISVLGLVQSTPITQLGINIDCHFKCQNEKNWHDFGHKIAPKSIWDQFLTGPGLTTMTMQGLNSNCKNGGYLRFKAEPSRRYGHTIYTQINNHFEFPSSLNADGVMKVITDKWDKIVDESFAKCIAFSKLEGL